MTNLNTFSQDKWRINFSNIPSVSSFTNMPLYDLFVKSIVLPDVNITVTDSNFLQYAVRHPISKGNVDVSQIQITFKVSEDLTNYINILEWILAVRYHEVDTDILRRNTIKEINIDILDNQKRKKSTMKFSECMITSLSSLSMNMGSSEETEFTCNFTYQEHNVTTY